MGYYIRILGKQDPDIHLDELLKALNLEGMTAKLAFADGDTPGKWTIIEIANNKGNVLAQIERSSVIYGELGKEELLEFKESVEDFKPKTASTWLKGFFDQVKVIYAFQMLDAAFEDDNYDIVNSIRVKIWNIVGGILQADMEGFSNEDGFHILWQFSDDVEGEYNCAVLDASAAWIPFEMDLGDEVQRKEFQEGKVPKNAKRLD